MLDLEVSDKRILNKNLPESKVRSYAQSILRTSRYITISEERIAEVALAFSQRQLSIPKWNSPELYIQSTDVEEVIKFFLIFNSINYCYFHHDCSGDSTIDENEKCFSDGTLSGARLAAKRITTHWNRLRDATFLINIDENYLIDELFAAYVPISLVTERVYCLREVGYFLNELDKQELSLQKLFSRLGGNAYQIAEKLPSLMPNWSDPFLKRAQLFVGMTFRKLQDRDDCPIEPSSLKQITAFADYRLPQTLIAMGILIPDHELETTLSKRKLIPSNSRLELEIRAATIEATDRLIQYLNCFHSPEQEVNALHVDYLLWSALKEQNDLTEGKLFIREIPKHHQTITLHY